MWHNVFDQNKPERNSNSKTNVFADFLQKEGLYESIDISEENFNELCDLIGGKVKLSIYCTTCKVTRVFSMSPIKIYCVINGNIESRSLDDNLKNCQTARSMDMSRLGETTIEKRDWYWAYGQPEKATRILVFPFVCAMDDHHHLDYIVRTEGNRMIKIGQFPSVADLSFPEIDEFKKDIDESSRREFRRAVGLYAQGIGIGSYVYLRRIFERILNVAKQKAEADGAIDLSSYDSQHVPERIKLLKNYLPEMINSNAVFYGIVSKGIHELSENDCIKYFPILQEAIFLILRQWAQKRKEQEAKKRLETNLSRIATEVLQ